MDGAWPASGLDAQGRYLFDASRGAVRSALTFLVYLNGGGGGECGAPEAGGGGGEQAGGEPDGSCGFEGGATTFFAPRPDAAGCLDARGVAPAAGNALVFPHGDSRGALVHEGSPVTAGAKFVIRSEVLYTRAPPDGSGRRGGGGKAAPAPAQQ